jgi:1-acyl-sn-glycerol-3-phosphate acyltransferase
MTGGLAPALRAALRLIAAVLLTLLLMVTWLARPFARLISARAAARLRARQMRAWARIVLRVLGVRVERDGTPPVAPFLLVSNHLSYLDVLVYWSQVECSFLSKADVRSWPLLGWAIRGAGTLFIDRSLRAGVRPALEAVRARLALGEGVILFPEGTSSPGDGILPLKASLFAAAEAADGRVFVSVISYGTDDPSAPARECVAWWGDMEFSPHFWRLLQIPRIRARVRFGDAPLTGGDRKLLARAAHTELERIFYNGRVPASPIPCPAAS